MQTKTTNILTTIHMKYYFKATPGLRVWKQTNKQGKPSLHKKPVKVGIVQNRLTPPYGCKARVHKEKIEYIHFWPVINHPSSSSDLQLSKPGGHPLGFANLPPRSDGCFFSVHKMLHLHLLPLIFTSHQPSTIQLGPPAEQAWGPSPRLC